MHVLVDEVRAGTPGNVPMTEYEALLKALAGLDLEIPGGATTALLGAVGGLVVVLFGIYVIFRGALPRKS